MTRYSKINHGIRGLSQVDTDDVYQLLCDALEDRDPSVCDAAVKALLTARNGYVRWMGAKMLAARGNQDAVNTLISEIDSAEDDAERMDTVEQRCSVSSATFALRRCWT